MFISLLTMICSTVRNSLAYDTIEEIIYHQSTTKQKKIVHKNNINSTTNNNIHGETIDVDEDSYIMQEETDSSESNSDLNSNTDLTSDNDVEIEADKFLFSEQKQASYYEQECYHRSKIKSSDASKLRETSNIVLSNYNSCTEQMKLVANSVALSLRDNAT